MTDVGLPIRANLNKATFRDADLRNANMSHVQMLDIDLYGAALFRTDFSHANRSDSAINRVDTSHYQATESKSAVYFRSFLSNKRLSLIDATDDFSPINA
ncbi:pentapeptide repeat-containing protein [Vibrio rarus]|uniref:pentapeptide repeat-containing protein n=1 Tax=Vibrio rarus TaxID=413403 RepID=UPI0039ED8689